MLHLCCTDLAQLNISRAIAAERGCKKNLSVEGVRRGGTALLQAARSERIGILNGFMPAVAGWPAAFPAWSLALHMGVSER